MGGFKEWVVPNGIYALILINEKYSGLQLSNRSYIQRIGYFVTVLDGRF